MAASTPGTRVEGIDELVHAFEELGGGLRQEFSRQLRTLVKPAVTAAQAIAAEKGLKSSGALIRDIRVSVRGTTAYITETAKRVSPKYPEGYPYPSIYEYRKTKQRAFIRPAVEATEAVIVAGFDQLIGELIHRAGFPEERGLREHGLGPTH